MMEFQMMGTTSCSLDNYLQGFPLQSRKFNLIKLHRLQYNMASWRSSTGLQRLFYSNVAVLCINPARHVSWRTLSTPVSLEESSLAELEDSSVDEEAPKTTAEDLLEKPWSSDELKALITDSERAKLIKKLSEANQQNRFLKRELHKKEDGLVNFKSELAVMELEIQALVALAEEIAKLGIPEGSRKINGRYIQSHLLSRLEAVDEKLKDQIKDVDAAQSKEVSLSWIGMAELDCAYLLACTLLHSGVPETGNLSVQVMGTFDGWSQGEHLSPEYNGSYSKFSTKLMLRPGRYEIKFLVDGEWQLLPEFPTVGEGLMKNNLLVVE